MDWLGQVAVGLGSAVAGFSGAFFLFRGKRVDQEVEESKVEATAADAFIKGQVEFQKYVDDVVDNRVSEAVKDLKGRLTDVEEKLTRVSRESHEMNDAIRTRETQLWLWNVRNRPGPMPELPEPIRARLGISHLSPLGDLEDTQPVQPPPEP